MKTIEYEKTYLAKYLPKDLIDFPFVEITDIYPKYGKGINGPRFRKRNDKYEITKKVLINNDPSAQTEHTIPLLKEEFEVLTKINAYKIVKKRYLYNCAEIDVFEDKLKGLVLVDFEFKTEEEKQEFKMPEYCLADVTNEDIIAGGNLSSKTIEDLREFFEKYGYILIKT
ncbi:MAG: hypothetical protein WCO33_04780 [bacterium]